MSAVRLVARNHLRRHWRSLAVLCFLCTLGGTITFGAFLAADRTGNSLARALEQARYAQGAIDVSSTDPALVDKVRALPAVRDAGLGAFVAVRPAGTDLVAGIDVVGVMPLDESAFYEINRPQMLEGRLPDPDRANEVALNPALASRLELTVGDEIVLESYRQSEVYEIFASAKPVDPTGRVIEAEVVGIGRDLNEVTSPGDGGFGGAFLSPAVFEEIGNPLLNFETEDPPDLEVGMFRLFLQVLLPESQEDPAPVVDAVYEIYGGGATIVPSENRAVVFAEARDSLDVERTALLAVGIVAAAASLFAVGQSAARQVGVLSADGGPTLRALGLPRAQRAAAAARPVIWMLLMGAGLAAGLATWSTTWSGSTLAREFDPEGGVYLDPLLLLGCFAAFLAVLSGSAAGVGWARAARERAVRHGAAATLRVSWPAVSMGLNLARARGYTKGRVPLRPAVAAAVAGIAGIVGALTFAAGLDRLVASSQLYGENWDLQVALQAEGERISDEALPGLLADERLAGIARYHTLELGVGEGRPLGGVVVELIEGSAGPTTLRGRLPVGEEEIAMRAGEASDLDASVGSDVDVSNGNQSVVMRVVGLLPGTASSAFVVGPDALSALHVEGEVEDLGFLLNLRPGVDVEDMRRDLGETFAEVDLPEQPPPIRNLERVRRFPYAVAGFLAALALTGTAHLLLTAVRRRAGEIAILKVIGFVRRQVRFTIVVQALLVAVIGVLAGIPLGIALGRTSWSVVASALEVIHAWRVPLQEIVLSIPIALLASVLLALAPAERAARLRPAAILHAE